MKKTAHVGVIASQEVTQKIRSALNGIIHAQMSSLDWPLAPATKQPEETPDLIVCEINDPSQATNYRQEISFFWPEAMLVSCEIGNLKNAQEAPVNLYEASQQAGYQGHVIIDEVALQLPIFLRYAEQRRVTDQQAHQVLLLKRLLNAALRMHASLDQQQVAAEILQEFGRWVKADNWQLYAVSDDGKFIELIGAEGIRIKPPSLTLRREGQGLIERVLQQGEIVVLNPAELEWSKAGERQKKARFCTGVVLGFPLKVGEEVVGVSQATRLEVAQGFSREEKNNLQQVSSLAALALKNATQFACAERLYMQDDLTQLHNSRFLRQFLENEFKRVRRYGGQVAVIFIDLDGFKGVNDRFGHRVGSETLKEMATLLMDSVRDTDVVTRYGGDEFTIVLPNTGAEKAVVTAERIRQKLAEHLFLIGEANRFHLTASFGIAAYPECSAQSFVDLLEKADLAMYEAKADNKNNVKLAKS